MISHQPDGGSAPHEHVPTPDTGHLGNERSPLPVPGASVCACAAIVPEPRVTGVTACLRWQAL